MAAEAPSTIPPESCRFSIGLPRPLWFGVGSIALMVFAVGLTFGIAYYWRQTAMLEIKQLGGRIAETRPCGPEWILNRVGEEYRGFFEEVIRVDLDRTEATDATLEHLSCLSGLQYLDLENTKVTDLGLAYLSRKKSLKVLWLNGTDISDRGLETLAKLDRLESLYLGDTRITDAGLVHIERMASLRRLWVHNTQVTDGGVANLRRTMPHLLVVR